MSAFRYHAIEPSGAAVKGEIEAVDRRSALQMLGARGIFPSVLESMIRARRRRPKRC